MRLAFLAVAASACAVFMAFMYLTNPRTVTRTVTKEVAVLTAKQTRGTVERAFANIEVSQEAIVANPAGHPMLCRTTSPGGDFDVYLQWCVKATLEEAATVVAGG